METRYWRLAGEPADEKALTEAAALIRRGGATRIESYPGALT